MIILPGENFEEFRERLLEDQDVQEMIQVRAYEIFVLRGRQPGNETRDWLQAEEEVLAFLIADLSNQIEDKK